MVAEKVAFVRSWKCHKKHQRGVVRAGEEIMDGA